VPPAWWPDYRPDSQVSRLNRDHRLAQPHPYLTDVLRSAQSMSARTGGAFDVTVQPLWELYAARQNGHLPSEVEVAVARGRVNWNRVECVAHQVRLSGKGTKITLNGIAQGFAADRVLHTLRGQGVPRALVDTGEVGVLGVKPGQEGWAIGIQHPRIELAYLALAKLANRCLATSGDYATTFSADRRHHHLFDPRTGDSPLELSSVSIAARTTLAADALSTAVLVLGLQAGLELLHRTPGADGLLVTKDGRTYRTKGFPLAG